jgi:hypothetical protein
VHFCITKAFLRRSSRGLLLGSPWIKVDLSKSDGAVVDFLREFEFSEGGWDESRFLELINEVSAYSLINFDETNQTVSIHPLVHAWTRTTLKDGEGIRTSTMQMLALLITRQSKTEDHAFRRRLLCHINEAWSKNVIDSDVAESFGQVHCEPAGQ